jgi:hypothetical protein
VGVSSIVGVDSDISIWRRRNQLISNQLQNGTIVNKFKVIKQENFLHLTNNSKYLEQQAHPQSTTIQ